MFKILKYGFLDLIRSNWLILYTLFYFVVALGVLITNGDVSKSIISLLNVIVIIIPLIAAIFGVIYYYNSREYIEMFLAQPMRRLDIFLGQFLGLALSLSVRYLQSSGRSSADISLVEYEEYPLEKFALASTLLNPIDLSRIFIMLKFDTAALFGYTGAIFNKFFDSDLGVVLAACALLAWCFIPLLLILRKAQRKDF